MLPSLLNWCPLYLKAAGVQSFRLPVGERSDSQVANSTNVRGCSDQIKKKQSLFVGSRLVVAATADQQAPLLCRCLS